MAATGTAPFEARVSAGSSSALAIAVVIPCFRVKRHIAGVIGAIGPEVGLIFVIDDKCPEQSGDFVESTVRDPRVRVIRHRENQGVGGAVMTGYRAAIDAGATVIVKIDGDGQMDPALVPRFAELILTGAADYVKGNRFFEMDGSEQMPLVRRVGNLGLSFFTKLSTGYWGVFDPTNGYTAIHATAAALLPMDKIGKRYFFESDILFRLGTIGAVVTDVPMAARYADEQSGLNALKALPEFTYKNLRNFGKRIFYNYFLSDFNIASIELVLGKLLLLFGTVFGIVEWIRSVRTGVPASAGTVMLAALPILIGFQLLLSFLNFDTHRAPTIPLHRRVSALSAAGVRAARSGRAKPE